jgi:hypothetical protein
MLPALVFLPFLLTSFPLLLIGFFKPVPVIVLWLALTAAAVPYAWRRIPSVTGAADWGTAGAGRARPTPRWVLWSLVAISVAFGLSSRRLTTPSSSSCSWTRRRTCSSATGSPARVAADPAGRRGLRRHATGVTYASAAFYQVGNSIVPQFMAGLPMLLSPASGPGGIRTALLAAPVLGALGIFTFGGLVARLVGPRWAPFAALAMGITIPDGT